jgi:hypothetical protein
MLLADKDPRFNAANFFLWRVLKGKFYINKPSTINNFKENIRHKTAAIPVTMLQRVFASLKHRVQLCVDAEGD